MERFVPTREPPPLPGARLLDLEDTPRDAGQVLHEGLEASVVPRLATHLDLPVRRVLELAGIPRSTYDRHRTRGQRLAPRDSEILLGIAWVIEAAEAYFEQTEPARAWLRRPQAALGGRAPLEVAGTSAGAAHVVRLLTRLEHGVVT